MLTPRLDFAIRESNEEAQSLDVSRQETQKNAGIIIGCIALVMFMLIIAKLWTRNRQNRRPEIPSSVAAGHVNSADFMRYCTRVEQRLAARETKRGVLSSSEVDIVAPERAYQRGQLHHTTSVPIITISSSEDSPSSQSTSLPSVQAPPPPYQTEPIVLPASTALKPAKSWSGSQSECSVCLGEFEDQSSVRLTSCGHLFHSHCLEKWLVRFRGYCPLCQTKLKAKNTSEH